MPASWFVVQTQPRAEAKARWHLNNQGFAVYLPAYRRRIRHARRSEVVLRPLFPGYLFVQINPEAQQWRSINGTVGVLRLLADGGTPRRMPAQVIDEIKAREDSAGAVKLLSPALKPGQTVRLVNGPFTDVSGLFEEMRDENRVILLLSLLGRQVRVTVSAAEVTAAA